ncbi:hypothetical protein ROT06_000270 [Pseudomonas aeruginosa]|uniref:hypothetical protein n=1 Tax=Pseudomonas aeruginosa TaxID=287 RepID=UPI00288194A3|nr:hypothetical protein [Pseudomonas aeruginosa]HCF9552152.1 hypothetical protein [Pseudomonas aeruginosa]
MAIVFVPVDIDDKDRIVRIGKWARQLSKECNIGICVCSIQMFNSEGVRFGKMYSSESTPGASPLMHAERSAFEYAIKKTLVKQQVLSQTALLSVQTNPGSISQHFEGLGIKVIDCFCELPPCPSCLEWWESLDRKFSNGTIFIKYLSEFEDYYGESPEDRMAKKTSEREYVPTSWKRKKAYQTYASQFTPREKID